MELFGTLMLWDMISYMREPERECVVEIPMATDNKGNTMSILNHKTKTWPSSIILMQLVWEAHKRNMEIGIYHTKRCYNTWADQLAAGDISEFDQKKRAEPRVDAANWDLLAQYTDPAILASVTERIKKRDKRTRLRQAHGTAMRSDQQQTATATGGNQ